MVVANTLAYYDKDPDNTPLKWQALLALDANISLGVKWMVVANTLAYYEKAPDKTPL